MLVLGIETSCDETAAAVVRDGREVLSSVVYSQVAQHRPYGGVVPEIASRSHVEVLPGVIADAVEEAKIKWNDLDAVAVTRGPGLASSLLVGLNAARALSLRLQKPLLGMNHLEGHLHSLFLHEEAPPVAELCPLLVLLVSGGHSCIVRMSGVGQYDLLGQTLDDAAGEALDKGASLMGLGYPGGPVIEKTAEGGDPKALDLPRGLTRGGDTYLPGGLERRFCFSFSGLKTALRYHLEAHPEDREQPRLRDVAASYQEAVVDALVDRLTQAVESDDAQHIACVGGVARNKRLRGCLQELACRTKRKLWLAPPAYCTDNAAMIAALAGMAHAVDAGDSLAMDIDPNLPIGA
jgi:N6-L-threonylcarbamoyladenine synthase